MAVLPASTVRGTSASTNDAWGKALGNPDGLVIAAVDQRAEGIRLNEPVEPVRARRQRLACAVEQGHRRRATEAIWPGVMASVPSDALPSATVLGWLPSGSVVWIL